MAVDVNESPAAKPPGAAGRIVLDTSKLVPTQIANAAQRLTGKRVSFSTSKFQEQVVVRSTEAAQSAPRGATPTLAARLKQDANGRTVVDYGLANVMPGRGNPASRISRLLQDRLTGVLIEFDLDLDGLVQGVNALTVVVIEKGGNRHQQNVTFTVAKPAAIRPPRLPGGSVIRPTVTLSGAVTKPKKPRAPVAINLAGSGRAKAVNTFLPVDAKTFARKQTEALKDLKTVADSHFQKIERAR
jgi:hypothetical protein